MSRDLANEGRTGSLSGKALMDAVSKAQAVKPKISITIIKQEVDDDESSASSGSIIPPKLHSEASLEAMRIGEHGQGERSEGVPPSHSPKVRRKHGKKRGKGKGKSKGKRRESKSVINADDQFKAPHPVEKSHGLSTSKHTPKSRRKGKSHRSSGKSRRHSKSHMSASLEDMEHNPLSVKLPNSPMPGHSAREVEEAVNMSAEEVKAVRLVQRWYRRKRFIASVEALIHHNKKRGAILRELLSTEKTYMAHLVALRTEWMFPLAKVLSKGEMESIFMNIVDLFKIHGQFLKDITPLIGDVQLRFRLADQVKDLATKVGAVYGPFLNNYESGSHLLSVAMAKSADVKRCVEGIVSPTGASGLRYLNMLMVTPMQRLPRYLLLIKELVKVTNPHYEDHKPLQEALEALKQATTDINEQKRKHDEQYMRGILSNSSYQHVLGIHSFKLSKKKAVTCTKCSKGFWSSGKVWRCAQCAGNFHNKCKDEIGTQKSCSHSERMDFSKKEILGQHEVFVQKPSDDGTQSADHVDALQTLQVGKSPRARGSRRGSIRAPLRKDAKNKCIVVLFQDGVGVARVIVNEALAGSNKKSYEFYCEMPWAMVKDCVELDQVEMERYPFVIRTLTSEWNFWLPTVAERNAIIKDISDAINTAHKKQNNRRLMKAESKAALFDSANASVLSNLRDPPPQ